MNHIDAFMAVLQEIDAILEGYSPPELVPELLVSELMEYHDAHLADLERAADLATQALATYPFHPALLLRRAEARALMRSGDLSAHSQAAEADLRLALEVDKNSYAAAGHLLHLLFTFSALEDTEVADVAGELSERATRDLLAIKALQIRALGYAERGEEGRRLYERWSAMFPESETLKEAFDDVASFLT